MTAFNSNIRIQRGGKRYRCQMERIFYIKHHGWFVHTRDDLEIFQGLELHNGIRGPFATQNGAKNYLLQLLTGTIPEQQERRGKRKTSLRPRD